MLSGERKGKCVDKGNRTEMDEYKLWAEREANRTERKGYLERVWLERR